MSINRRSFLRTAGYGLGSLALARLLQGEQGSALPTHHPAKAKRVLFLHMAGAPSQLDLLDPKPKLVELDKQPVPESFIRGERFAFIKGHPKVLASPYKFARHGQSGAEFSELLPRMSTQADRWTILRAMHTTEFNHAPAQLFLSTGHPRAGRPSFGAWMSHGLGTLNENLPTYVVLNSGRYGPDGGASLWGAGFLEGRHQGVRLRSNGAPVLFLEDPPELSREARRDTLDTLGALNREHAQRTRDPEIDTRIAQYELAFRMQQSCPEMSLKSQRASSANPLSEAAQLACMEKPTTTSPHPHLLPHLHPLLCQFHLTGPSLDQHCRHTSPHVSPMTRYHPFASVRERRPKIFPIFSTPHKM
ncbi:MAG: DUF1501 domain-containing protein [Planctomycetia bacterium]